MFFWLFIVTFFFSGFLPVLRTMCRWKSSLHPVPILFDVFLIIFFCCFLRVLPVLRTMCRWTSSLHPFPILIDFFRVFASFENNLQMKTFPTSFPHTICFFFPDYFLFFFLEFLPVLRTICRWKPSLPPFPILLDFFLIIFCFFLRVLPVLKKICKWKPSLHPFPILFVFFSDYLLFFSWVFASFENNLQMKTFPASFPHTIGIFLIIFCFFLRVLPVLRPICKWKPSLHPFPILFVFFLIIIIIVFFRWVFASFEPSLHPFLILFDLFLIIFWALILSSLFFASLVCFFVDFLFWIKSLFFGVCGVLRVHNASVFDTEVWKWYCFSVGTASQDLGGLVKWRVPLLVYGIDFEEQALNMKVSMQNKHGLISVAQS